VVMDPWTGRVLAMVGGFSFDQSQFNRATQAYRQPGSSFKPLVYSAAMDNGYTPSTIVVDAPIEIDQGQGAGVWRPENYSTGKYYGPQTLRNALKRSLNTVTVRLAQDVGMPLIGEYSKRFGVYDELPNYLSYALGAGETTVMRMVTAYSMFANGGRRVKSTLIDRIQDRYGRTIFRHDARECRGCDAPGGWKNQPMRNGRTGVDEESAARAGTVTRLAPSETVERLEWSQASRPEPGRTMARAMMSTRSMGGTVACRWTGDRRSRGQANSDTGRQRQEQGAPCH